MDAVSQDHVSGITRWISDPHVGDGQSESTAQFWAEDLDPPIGTSPCEGQRALVNSAGICGLELSGHGSEEWGRAGKTSGSNITTIPFLVARLLLKSS